MSRTPCIVHPPNHAYIQIKQWQSDFFGDATTAALLAFFEYWHTRKLSMLPMLERENAVAEMHGDSPSQNTSLLQHHTEEELEAAIMNIGKRSKIRKALKTLVQKGLISVHKNPNPKYKFDKTKHFLFNVTNAQAVVDEWIANHEKPDPLKITDRSSSNASRCVENTSPCVENNGTSPEIYSEISNEINTPLTPQGGNACDFSENSQTEETGDRNPPPFDQQATQSGCAQKRKSSAAKKTTEQILAALPEPMQARFTKFWAGYSAFCEERSAKTGAKKQAAIAWEKLVNTDFNGRGLEGFNKGVGFFLRQQGDRTAGIPHACRFLHSAKNGSGAWEDAIEQAQSKGKVSDMAPNVSDRGNSPPVYTAADFPEPISTPEGTKAGIAKFREALSRV